MVSNASEDLPLPDSPVMTTSLSRGMVRLMFLRLCCLAPRISIASRGISEVWGTSQVGIVCDSPSARRPFRGASRRSVSVHLFYFIGQQGITGADIETKDQRRYWKCVAQRGPRVGQGPFRKAFSRASCVARGPSGP